MSVDWRSPARTTGGVVDSEMADWPIMVTPPRFFRTVLIEAKAPSSSCPFFMEEKISSMRMCFGTPRLAGSYSTSLMRRSSQTIRGSNRSAYCSLFTLAESKHWTRESDNESSMLSKIALYTPLPTHLDM